MSYIKNSLKKLSRNILYGFGGAVGPNFFKPMLGDGIILCYHSIFSKQPINSPLERSWLSIDVEDFRSHIAFLSSEFECVSMDQMLNKHQPVTGRKLCCITFDDGYRDNLYNALPVLEEYEVPATVFVTTFKSLIARPAYEFWPEFFGLKDAAIEGLFLSISELQELSDSKLITIGAHGDSHVKLSGLTPLEVEQELDFSKKYLEDCTGKLITHFAYPHGAKDSFSEVHIDLLKDAGFLTACTTSPDPIDSRTSSYMLPRTLVLPHVGADRIAILSSGLSNIVGRTF